MRALLDSSVVVGALRREPLIAEVAQAFDEGAFMSACNFAEVATFLTGRGDADIAIQVADSLQITVVPLLEDMALMAADEVLLAKPLGLSLADRCCLATAMAFDATHVLTTDRAWLKLPEPYASRVVFARPD